MKRFLINFILLLLVAINICIIPKTIGATSNSSLNFSGETIIYKNKNSIFTINDIYNLIMPNFNSSNESSINIICLHDEYTGKGNILGRYTISFQCLDSDNTNNTLNQDIYVIVKELKCDYIYDSNFYISNNEYSKEDLMFDCKSIGLIPNENIQFNCYCDFFDNNNDEKEIFDFMLEYYSSSGIYGSVNGNLNYNISKTFENFDKKLNKIDLKSIFITIFILILGFILLKNIIKKQKKIKRRFN